MRVAAAAANRRPANGDVAGRCNPSVGLHAEPSKYSVKTVTHQTLPSRFQTATAINRVRQPLLAISSTCCSQMLLGSRYHTCAGGG
jgi:hypothetical protein